MAKVGILGAMSSEIALLKERMSDRRKTERAGRTFYEGKISGADVVLVCCGVGKVNSALTCQMLIDWFGVDTVINIGVAGSGGEAKVRDIVVSTDALYHDLHGITPEDDILADSYPFVSSFAADPKLVQLAAEACRKQGVQVYTGRIATGDQFVGSKAQKDDIVARTHPMAVEMEGGSIAHACAINGVPFVIIRSISDNADDGAEMSFETFEVIAANDAAEIVTTMLQNL